MSVSMSLIQLRFSSGWYLITGDASDLGLFCSETLLEEKNSLCCQKTSPDWTYSSLDLFFLYKYYMIVIVSFVAGVIFSFKIFFQMQSLGRQRRVYCPFLDFEISLTKCYIYLFIYFNYYFFFFKGVANFVFTRDLN